MAHTQITYVPELNVGARPDITAEWCGYNPSQYKFDAFLHGIFIDTCLGAISKIKKRMPAGHAFLMDAIDPSAVLGDAFRHIEFGKVFGKDYQEVQKPGESLAAVSASPVNIIVETDKTIEKWEASSSHNLYDFPEYFYSYQGFETFMAYLKGPIEEAILDMLSLIIKAVIGSNPANVIIDDTDFARIFGKTGLNPSASQEPSSEEAKEYNALMREKTKKYFGKAAELWKNVHFYNPYHFSYTNEIEEPRKDFIFEGAKPKQDKAKKFAQEIYTAAHGEDESGVTKAIQNLHRNDCLFALFDFISKATQIMFTEKTAEFCLGTDTTLTIYDTKEAKKRILANKGLGLDGRPVAGQGADGTVTDTKTTSKNDQNFQAITEPQYLGIYLNPEDYMDLKAGIARRGQMDNRAVKLADLGDLNIFPDRVIPPGFVRMFDKRAFIIKPYYNHTDLATPKEKLHLRFKLFYQTAIAIFKNFCGTLGVPTPHFIPAPIFYNRHGLLGQEIEKKK